MNYVDVMLTAVAVSIICTLVVLGLYLYTSRQLEFERRDSHRCRRELALVRVELHRERSLLAHERTLARRGNAIKIANRALHEREEITRVIPARRATSTSATTVAPRRDHRSQIGG